MCDEKQDTHDKDIALEQSIEANTSSQGVPSMNAEDIPSSKEASSSMPTQSADLEQDALGDVKKPKVTQRKKVSVKCKKTENRDVPSLDAGKLPKELTGDSSAIDAAVQQNTIESDQDYREITKTIIQKTSAQLEAHTNAKKPLRLILLWFVVALLSAQFIALVFILFFNNAWQLEISDYIINVYVVSLFLETLAGLIIMIKFSFDSKQEVQLIEVLNAIIRHFKKFDDK